MSSQEVFDVTIIGGGPAGLYAAFYSGLRGMKVKLIEAQPHLGGKVHIYPEKVVWDVGGLTPTTGSRLAEQLIQQGLTFHPTVILGQKVERIAQGADGSFILNTSQGSHVSKTIIMATGSGIVQPQKIKLRGADRFEVSNLHYTVKRLDRFKGKRILISGGGNSAVDWASELQPFAQHITLVYRKTELAAHEAQVERLVNKGNVSFRPETRVSHLQSEDGEFIQQVELTNMSTGETEYCEVDEVIVNHGYERDASLLEKSELAVEGVEDGVIRGNAYSESSVPGLYAAGDVLRHEGKVHLLAGAFHDAVHAVNRAKTFIDPKAEQVAMVSSHNERLTEKNREVINRTIKNQ